MATRTSATKAAGAKKKRAPGPSDAHQTLGKKSPVRHSEEIARRVCEELTKGRSLMDVCRDPGMPTESAVRLWVLGDVAGFAADYARARSIGYDVMAESILELADTPNVGTKSVSKATGLEITEGDNVERSRLQVDARKWLLSKMLPKKYGEKSTVDLNVNTSLADRLARARKRAAAPDAD